ncbi:radical SAM protein [Clostridia bacterium]|nr:radical SAM protein [Clostridia bacterium]
MSDKIDIEKYLSDGVEVLVKGAMKATLKNPKESAFLMRYAAAAKKSAKLRPQAEMNGEHIPSFLIASITTDCNLRCVGCYAHAGQQCAKVEQMSQAEWKRVFTEAENLGVAIILLAGGEPLMRRDVIEAAAKHKGILFPIFTNATMLDNDYLRLFGQRRNLVPIVSIEGNEIQTNARRGNGIYKQTVNTMKALLEKGLLFGVSITVTTDNLSTVTDAAYIDWLRSLGCKVTLFVEYVPFESKELALGEQEREGLSRQLDVFRAETDDMILISFPGDEKETGGCLAAGRGFFHINASGGAEPCPFSSHSDTNLKTATLRQALQSPLFLSLRNSGLLIQEHTGGCTLFEFDDKVAALLSAGEKIQE